MESESAAREPEHRVADQGDVIREWKGPLGRLNAWRKRTPLNPYWIERVHLHRAVRRLAPEASGRLLDVGGGERPYGELFEPHVTRYVGLEYPPAADNLIPSLWKVLSRLHAIVDVFGDGARLPFRDESFDTAMLLEVLEHVPDPERLLAEARRALRPGGRLLVTVPFTQPLHQIPFDYYRYTPEGLRALLERNGFEVQAIEPRGNFPAAVGALVSQWLLRALGRKRHRDGSVSIGRWRAPFVLPLLALVQLLFAAAARLSSDTTLCLGYTAVARRTSSADGAPTSGP